MRTISSIVKDIIKSTPFLAESLSEHIANTSKVARLIKKRVEAKRMEKVSEASIGMALRRMKKDLQRQNFGTTLLQHLHDITVRSDLVEFILAYHTSDFLRIHRACIEAQKNTEGFFNISHGLRETIIIVSADLEHQIKTILKKIQGVKRIGNLSSITIRLPEKSMVVPGVYYPILKVLAWEGINLIEIVSIATELSLIFDAKDVDHAFSVIKSLIKE